MSAVTAANFQTLVWDRRIFVILQTFLQLCLYMLKTKTFLHIPSQNHQQSTLKFKNFDYILQEKFCDFRQKREKRPHPAGSSCA